MDRVGLFYGPVGGSTEKVAKKIAGLLGKSNCTLVPVGDAKAQDLDGFSNIIFGIATIGNETWNSEPVKSGWFTFMNELEKLDLKDKVISLYGLGDHIRYADHFVDAMGELNELLNRKGIKSVGRVPTSDYTFGESRAIEGTEFVGLPVDEDFEESLTDERLTDWVEKLKNEFR